MFSTKAQTKTVISVSDSEISYLNLGRDLNGFFVIAHEKAKLDEGVIKKIEILKAEFFLQVINKLSKKIKQKDIEILLPYEYFFFETIEFPEVSKRKRLEGEIKDFLKNIDSLEFPWFETHHVDYSVYLNEGVYQVLFYGLPKELHESYRHIFTNTEFRSIVCIPNILAFDLYIGNDRVSVIDVEKDIMRVIEFKRGVYSGEKKFKSSLVQFIKDIKKDIDISDEAALKIFLDYGFLRSHKDQKVHKRIVKSISPLLDFFAKRKIKEESKILINFQTPFFPGFIDSLSHVFSGEIRQIDILKDKRYIFHDVLSIHKNEMHSYQALIAQALKSFKQ
jgi:Tfp pilus assembly PilM family ATPase